MNTEIVAAIEQHLKGPSRLDAVENFIVRNSQALARLDDLIHQTENDQRNIKMLAEEIETLRRRYQK